MSFAFTTSADNATLALANFSTMLAQAATDNSLSSEVVASLTAMATSNVALLPVDQGDVRVSVEAVSDGAGAIVSLNISAGLL